MPPPLSFTPFATATERPGLAELARATRIGRSAARASSAHLLSFGSIYSLALAPARGNGRRLATFLRGSLKRQEEARGASWPRRLAARAVEEAGVRLSDAVLDVSPHIAPASRPAAVIPNEASRLPLIEKARSRQVLGVPQEAFVVGYVGGYAPVKNGEVVARAVRADPESFLLFGGVQRNDHNVGGGEGAARRLVRGLVNEGRAVELAWRDPALLLSAIDVFVAPSFHEGSPNALLEALGSGLACLGARSPGIRETLGPGLPAFDPYAFRELQEILLRLRRNRGELDALRADSGRRGRELMFDWDERASAAILAAFTARESAERTH
jgi:glycosyltransferase involved in cell wall biosynthesis